MNPRAGFAIGVLLIIAALGCVLGATLARPDDPVSKFWRDVKNATLVNGRTNVNCCGEGDAVYVRVLAADDQQIMVEVIDHGQHKKVPVGLHVRVPIGLYTKGIPNPLGRAVLFMAVDDLRPLCFIEDAKG